MKSAWLLLLGCIFLQGLAFQPNSAHIGGRRYSPCTSGLFNAPDPLATEGEWTAYLDEETTGVVYYFNSRTGESRWEPPTKTFPSIYLKPSRRRKAEEKREQYFKSIQEKGEKKGFFSSLLETKTKEDEKPNAIVEEPEWMKSILEEKYPEEPAKKPGLFARLLKLPAPEAESSTPAPSPAMDPQIAKDAPAVKKGFLDNLFESLTTTDGGSGVENPTESPLEVAAQVERIAAEKMAAAEKADEERKRKERGAKAVEDFKLKTKEEKGRKKAEEEASMMEQVRKAEAEQKSDLARIEAQTKKAAEEAKKAEAAEAKIAADEAKLAEETAKMAVVEEQITIEEEQAPIKIDVASCVLPHPSKILWGGEDAVFTKGRTFGVFDGVSGADKLDGLPLYSKMLARQMTQLVGSGNDLTIKDLQDQLLTAAEVADERATGASTAIVASITEDGFLRAINLGDSACIVVRDGRIVAKTKEIVHYFDCPYQLSENSPDRPRDARKLNFELLRGDTILMGSDGIFDNLEDAEIVDLVTSGNGGANAIAKRVSDRSRKVSLNSKAPTPYSKQAKKNGDPDFRDGLGGKVDDISCVVVRCQ